MEKEKLKKASIMQIQQKWTSDLNMNNQMRLIIKLKKN